MAVKRLGIIGFGFIGHGIYDRLEKHADLDIAFVWNRSAKPLANVPSELVLGDLDDFASFQPDLVIEMAHPTISTNYGKAILNLCDYMMLSVTAMADSRLSATLTSTAKENGTSLFIPHGALTGLDSLRDGRNNWAEVSITFRKHPNSLDFSSSDLVPENITSETVLYDGSVRGAAKMFPRNVNTMATCALASLGFDETRGTVIADPSLSSMSSEVRATGKDGSLLETRKVEQAVGVSGAGMIDSQWGSVCRASLGGEPGLNFV